MARILVSDRAPTTVLEAGVRHDAALVVATYDLTILRPAGLAWDDPYLWVVSDASQTIYKLEPPTMAIVASFPTPPAVWSFGLDHDGTNLWGDLDEPAEIYSLDDETGAVLTSFPSPFQAPNGVAWDGAGLWHSGFLEDLALIDTGTGGVIRSIPAPGNRTPRGLEWDGTWLWVVDGNTNPDDAIYQIDPADGGVVASYQPAGVPVALMYGLAFDGTYLWLSDLNAHKIHKLVFGQGLIFVDGFDSGDTSAWSSTVP